MEKVVVRCHDIKQARFVMDETIWPAIKNSLASGNKAIVECRPETRSLNQNALFHSICNSVANHGFPWMGRSLTAQQWKILFISGHAIATGDGADIIEGIEGEYVNIRESTAKMSRKRAESLIEYVLSWCAGNGVKLPAHHEEY